MHLFWKWNVQKFDSNFTEVSFWKSNKLCSVVGLGNGLSPKRHHGPLNRYTKLWVAHAPGRFPRHRLQRKPLVSDPDMHHSTCVTHVPWCMSGSLNRGDGENVPGIPGACATRNMRYLARGPCPCLVITVTSKWAPWRLKSPASQWFTQTFIQAQIKENIKAPRHWPLCGEVTGDPWIPRRNDQ